MLSRLLTKGICRINFDCTSFSFPRAARRFRNVMACERIIHDLSRCSVEARSKSNEIKVDLFGIQSHIILLDKLHRHP